MVSLELFINILPVASLRTWVLLSL